MQSDRPERSAAKQAELDKDLTNVATQNQTRQHRELGETGKRERQVTFADLPLFASERDISIALMGPGQYSTWGAIVPLLEHRGFPTIDGLMGGRYTPAIRAFFDREYGIHGDLQVRARHQPAKLGAYKGKQASRKKER